MFLEFSAVGKVIGCILRSSSTIQPDKFGAVSFELPLHKCYCKYTNKPASRYLLIALFLIVLKSSVKIPSRQHFCRCSFSPSKYRIDISSMKALTELQRFWCCIYAKLSANKVILMPLLLHQESCQTLTQMAESINTSQCTTLTFVTLCKAIHGMVKVSELTDESKSAVFVVCLLNWFVAPMHGLSFHLEESHRNCTSLSIRQILAKITELDGQKMPASISNTSSSRISMEGAVREAHILISDLLVRQFQRTASNHQQTMECLHRSTEVLVRLFIPMSKSLRVFCLQNYVRLCRDSTYVDNSLEGVVPVFVDTILKLLLIGQQHSSGASNLYRVDIQRLIQLCCGFSTIDILCTYAQKSLSRAPAILTQGHLPEPSTKNDGIATDSSRKRKRSRYSIVDNDESGNEVVRHRPQVSEAPDGEGMGLKMDVNSEASTGTYPALIRVCMYVLPIQY